MTAARDIRLVLVTAPDRKTARRLARGAVESRLAACANIVPGLESLYWWQGKVERGAEVLILFKTTQARLQRLRKRIVAEHPYDTPEFLVFAAHSGAARYLNWIRASLRLPAL